MVTLLKFEVSFVPSSISSSISVGRLTLSSSKGSKRLILHDKKFLHLLSTCVHLCFCT